MNEEQVKTVMIRCPSTNQPISTGMGATKIAYEGSTFTNNSVSCPACGQVHTWNKSDSWLKE